MNRTIDNTKALREMFYHLSLKDYFAFLAAVTEVQKASPDVTAVGLQETASDLTQIHVDECVQQHEYCGISERLRKVIESVFFYSHKGCFTALKGAGSKENLDKLLSAE